MRNAYKRKWGVRMRRNGGVTNIQQYKKVRKGVERESERNALSEETGRQGIERQDTSQRDWSKSPLCKEWQGRRGQE